MRIMVDLNVLLDVAQSRAPFYLADFVGSIVPAITPADFLALLPAPTAENEAE